MDVRPTRGERTRRRRARRRAVLFGCGVLAVTVSFAAASAAQPESSSGDAKSQLGVQDWGKPARHDTGVWAVEGRRALATMSGRVEETAASDTGRLGRRPVEVLRVVVQGKAHDVVTNATTVGQLLSAMRIEPDGDDVVAPSPSTPISSAPKVVYRHVTTRKVTEVASLPAPPSEIPAEAGPDWRVPSISFGSPGQVLRTYRVRYVDGKEVSRRLVFTRLLRAPVPGRELADDKSASMIGEASWYYVNDRLNAASPWLPIGTPVKVTNLATGATITVVINDRGPYGGRLIDLSEYAFSQIAPLGQGTCLVRISW